MLQKLFLKIFDFYRKVPNFENTTMIFDLFFYFNVVLKENYILIVYE